MAPTFPLEEFRPGLSPAQRTTGKAKDAAKSISTEAIEKSRLTGYEAGYQAGWDDAARSEADDQNRIGAEFSRNLQDMGFTFQEARAHVMHALEPLLCGMVNKVLPEVFKETIGQLIVEELLGLASSAADTPIEVVVPPSSVDVLETMLATNASIPFSLVEEPTLAEGQIFLRSGEREKHLDLPGALQKFQSAINDLYELNERAFQNG